jgi:hypothetical protein
VLLGYFVGNRGFAQMMPAPWLPLLPAEFALLVAGGWMIVQCAFAHAVPFRRDALNIVVLIWVLVGTARVIFDVRQFGLVAVRDYAMIYYALFFFLAQHIAADARARKFLLGVLAVASVLQPIAAVLVELFPEFFLGRLTFRGVPLIYFKGDLALTFTAVCACLVAFLARENQRWWAWSLATIELLYVLGGGNRASMLGALAALAWIALSRARKFVLLQAAAIVVATLLLMGTALLTENAWAQRKLDGLTDRVASLTDMVGTRTYVSEESFMKGDNNRFRWIWWRTVVDDTLAQNPVFGLGFGYDLARAFVQEYNPDMAEEFTARSPHSIAVSAIGRMGIVGLSIFGALCLVLGVRTWRIMRTPAIDLTAVALWASIWVILVSACFGVVLEGPMGAVVFWTLLGLANTSDTPAAEETIEGEEPAADETAAPDDQHLRPADAAPQVGGAP